MKRIIFMFALVLGLSACDNTKIKLHAPQATRSSETAAVTKGDSLQADSLATDSAQAATPKKVLRISTM